MYHINKLKVKELLVLLRDHFGSERLMGNPKKVELVEAVTGLFWRDWGGLMQRVGGGGGFGGNELDGRERDIFSLVRI